VQHSERVERLWLTRLRWRMRGAWLWPAFFGLTVVDGILITELPPYGWTPPGLTGGLLLAGFANLVLVAVVAPFAGRLLRRRRPDLPRPIAFDYAGTALLCVLAVTILVAGIAHRPAVEAQRADEAAMFAAVRAYVIGHAPAWEPGLSRVDVRGYAPEVYRACVPGRDPRRWLCLIVDTDRRPPRVVRDNSMEPNSATLVSR
jgi:hypothetical protein